MATEQEIDSMLVHKAACRVALAGTINNMLRSWRQLPDEQLARMQEALIATLADLTAEVALGVKDVSRDDFLHFVGLSFDKEKVKQDAVESGAFV